MRTKKPIIDLEAVKSHVLWTLWRKDGPVSPGEIKSNMMGVNVTYDEVYDSLWQLNYVVPVHAGIQLTEEGKQLLSQMEKQEQSRMQEFLFVEDFEMALLDFLYHRPHLVKIEDFPELLVEHAPQHRNSIGLGNLMQAVHQMSKYIDHPETKWFGINDTGRNYYEFRTKKPAESSGGRTSDAAGGFTEKEKQEWNRKLDEILTKLGEAGLEHEAIWTDMKEDIGELKDLYHLSKKNWRQLFLGKMAEWGLGGIVAEGVSKPIVDAVSPLVKKLLGIG